MESTDLVRFWRKVNKTGTCWLWTGYLDRGGYGRFSVGASKGTLAHRFAYATLVGPIPDGMTIDHLCHRPSCVNPAHLRAVSNKGNSEHMRGASVVSTTGIRGVFWIAASRRWLVQVMHRRESIYLGTYDDKGEAEAVAIVARSILFQHSDYDKRAASEASKRITPHGMRYVEKARNWTPGAGRPLRTGCDKGHEYTEENVRMNKDGSRSCRTCEREKKRRYRAAARALRETLA